MPCFLCYETFSNTCELFDHIKDTHKIRNRAVFTCSLCYKAFQAFGPYKAHMKSCVEKVEISNQAPIHLTDPETHEMMLGLRKKNIMARFSKEISESAVSMATEFSGNMNFPR